MTRQARPYDWGDPVAPTWADRWRELRCIAVIIGGIALAVIALSPYVGGGR